MKSVEIGGVRYRWSDILKARREQRRAGRQQQPTLFPLKDDARPLGDRSPAERYQSPSLFTLLEK